MNPKFDIHDYEKRYKSSLCTLEKSGISNKNKELIQKFDRTCALENLSISRRIRIIGTLNTISKFLDVDFDKASKDDLKNVVLKIDTKKEWSIATKHTYKAIIKKFYKWLAYGDEYKDIQDYPEIISWMKVSIKSKDQPRINASDILTEPEIEKLINVAEHPRDKAFISMLYELGARIGEIGSLRIKDVSRDKYSFIIDLSGKTGHRTPRIVISDPHLSSWLNIHPMNNNPNAPLWIMLGNRNKNERMMYAAFRALVLRLKERAQIKKRIYPHLFRHTRATHLLRNKQINESQAKVYFGWVPSSKMLSEYSHLVSQDVNDIMLEIHGIKTSENKREAKIKNCPRCKQINPKEHLFCKNCGSILDMKTAVELDDKRKGFDDIASSLMLEENVQEALLKAMMKKGLGKNLMELWRK
ncbi:tyrosine-type recombinase/integrase [Candidatus Latescibacterota bacterium]